MGKLTINGHYVKLPEGICALDLTRIKICGLAAWPEPARKRPFRSPMTGAKILIPEMRLPDNKNRQKPQVLGIGVILGFSNIIYIYIFIYIYIYSYSYIYIILV